MSAGRTSSGSGLTVVVTRGPAEGTTTSRSKFGMLRYKDVNGHESLDRNRFWVMPTGFSTNYVLVGTTLTL